jgi:hypothetical protein
MGRIWAPVQLSITEPRMAKYRDRVNSHEYFGGDNPLELPDLLPETFVPDRLAPWHIRAEYPGAAVHFFTDDYRFEAAWNDPPATLARLGEAEAVLSPDFSLWREMPLPMLIWQVYRSRWLGAYWQSRGLRVIPTAEWTTPVEEWMFDGLPRRSVLAVQTFNKRDDEARAAFEEGWRMMESLLAPETVLVYGTLPFSAGVPVREYPTFTTANRRRLI